MTPKTTASPQLDLLFDASPLEAEPEARRDGKRGQARQTWLVRQLVAAARELVEAEFGSVWVEGEISNCRPASSGHLYFTLKDAEAQLPVVLFRRQALLLRFRPEDGLHVRVRGAVSVYEQRGQLQLVAETMEPVGAGSLQLAFEQLRDKLKAEGLFDRERKRTLPAFPRTVAVVTSPTGAVIRDFLNIVSRRHSGLNVVVVPSAVQGENAPAEIEAALRLAQAPGLADLIVLARGGGSMEDLAAFNSERVARAIAASALPVVSAIGHETDFTIADFVADLRAPTPSAAAELITDSQHRVEEQVAGLSNRLLRAARFQLLQCRQRLARLPMARAEQRMATALYRQEQRLDELAYRMESAMEKSFGVRRRGVAEREAAVLRHDPRRQVSRAREALAAGEARLRQALERTLAAASERLRYLESRLYHSTQAGVAGRKLAFASLRGQLQSLSPLGVLERGYALVEDERGGIVRSVGQLSKGSAIRTRLGDGAFASTVTSIGPKTKKKDKSASA